MKQIIMTADVLVTVGNTQIILVYTQTTTILEVKPWTEVT